METQRPIRNKDLFAHVSQAKSVARYKTPALKINNYLLTRDIVQNALICSYASIQQINWNELPNKIVIKSNRGCSCNRVKCLEWSKDRKKYYDLLHRKWLTQKDLIKFFAPEFGEILIEKYLESPKQGKIPWDFKFYIAYDEMILLRVIDRNPNQKTKHRKVAFFNHNLKRISFYDWFHSDYKMIQKKNKKASIFIDKDPFKLPPQIHQAKELAIKVGKHLEIPFVSVDMYILDSGEIYLGELTFIPGAVMYEHIQPKYVDLITKKVTEKKNLILSLRHRF